MSLNKFCLGQSLKTLSQGRVPSSVHVPEPPVDTQWGPSSPRMSSARTEQHICAGGGFSTKLEHLWCKMRKRWGEKWKEQEEVTKDGRQRGVKRWQTGERVMVRGKKKEKKVITSFGQQMMPQKALGWPDNPTGSLYSTSEQALLTWHVSISGQTGIPYIWTVF